VARRHVPVTLAPEARDRVREARDVVERLVREGRAVYGVTTGLGASKDVSVGAADLESWPRRVVESRAVAVGPLLPTDVVRAMLLARASGMARGGSGARPEILDGLIAMLNRGVHPSVPMWGSVGAADLGLLAALALPLIGLGEAEVRGERLPGAEALRRADLAPLSPDLKDGLALVSANAASAGHGALVVQDAVDTIDAATVAAALSMEAFRANVSSLDPRVHAAHPACGQGDEAARLRALLSGSTLWDVGAARSVQDPITFRCVSQIHGAARGAVGGTRRAVEVELVAASDNPLVVPGDGVVLHNGNFHPAALALAFDLVGLAIAQVATAAAGRVLKLMSPAHSGLPAFLSPAGPPSTGLAPLQKPLTALAAEIRHLANPASLDFMPVSEGVEDHATMAPFGVRKTADLVDRLRYVVAIELLSAAQAVDLRPPDRLGRGTAAARASIRGVAEPLRTDRVVAPDVEAIHALLTSGALLRTTREAIG
jgi:histidine ammonia-lyase